MYTLELTTYSICSKVWNPSTGSVLHTFTHSHIVRTIAPSPNASHLLTGGNEKKIRLFDLNRPEAEGVFLRDPSVGGAGEEAHGGTVKGLVWIDGGAVSVSEDRTVK